ncbi:unnamed protein product [Bursaphelenchus xylophilus]|uniref:(pine wood nematode) hypothetical protein n=1 Tax=Bursaphelenchus xylophilus TaxID=6326 RepID=A0A1I7S473_BURXY|nr:unnamed protein product [Bursaphelenchus xylophilus]CAG9116795.1 unnamed protein product [Bursaphelenchus xylophilus]
MFRKETGLRAPSAGALRTRSSSTSNLTRPTASSLNRTAGISVRNTSVPPNGAKGNIAKPVIVRPVTRAFSKSQSNVNAPPLKPSSTLGRGQRFHSTSALSKKPVSAADSVKNNSQSAKENLPVRPSTASSTAVSSIPPPRMTSDNEFGEFKPLSSVDLDSLCRNNQNGITRMTILSTNFLDPVQRKAFLEMKRKVQQRMSVDYTRNLVANNPGLLGSEAVRSVLREENQKNLMRHEETRNVKFADTSEVRRIPEEGQTTPTSRQFLERVKNAPVILQTPQNAARKSIYTTPKRVEPFKYENRLSEGVEDELEESPPEPTPSKVKKMGKVEPEEQKVEMDEQKVEAALKEDAKTKIKRLLTEFSDTFNNLTFAEIQSLKAELESSTIVDSVKACLKILSD